MRLGCHYGKGCRGYKGLHHGRKWLVHMRGIMRPIGYGKGIGLGLGLGKSLGLGIGGLSLHGHGLHKGK